MKQVAVVLQYSKVWTGRWHETGGCGVYYHLKDLQYSKVWTGPLHKTGGCGVYYHLRNYNIVMFGLDHCIKQVAVVLQYSKV